MSEHTREPGTFRVTPEKLAYWYLRLNGFLTIENFIIHDERGKQQRTDIDIVAVRFPHRQEALRGYGDEQAWMDDDPILSSFSTPFAAFVEVKTSRCAMNGPWTDKSKGNIPRALRALGALPAEAVQDASEEIYKSGLHQNETIRVGLVSIGRERNPELASAMPDVIQITWDTVKRFIFDRFQRFERVKREHPQWDREGHLLWNAFKRHRGGRNEFSSALIFPNQERR